MPRYKTYSQTTATFSGIQVQICRKNVKNLNLRVYPSRKEVNVSVPKRAPKEVVHNFIESRLPWIKKHLNRTPKQKNISPRISFTSGETHYVWGKPYVLKVIQADKAPNVNIIGNNELLLQVRPGTDSAKKEKILNEWYRKQLKETIPELIARWEPEMGVSVEEFGVKRMKTRWGTCNIRDKRIWLNLELAKKRPEFLEYVVVHEMVHLLERLHNKQFYAHMTRFFPQWKKLKNELNGSLSFSDC